MQIKHSITQSQRLNLTTAIQQSLQYLQLPIQELGSYLEELSMKNPLLEVELPPIGEPYPHEPTLLYDNDEILVKDIFISEGRRRASDGLFADFTALYTTEKSLPEYLLEQLGQMPELDDRLLKLCRYLVGCLNSAGYMDCPLPELAGELGISLFDVEQALYVIQMLDPPGVGARDLSECLLIQLAQSSKFNALNVALVRVGLPLLAENDMAGLCRLLDADDKQIAAAADIIRSLNPIPSQGFGSGEGLTYIVPEATVYREGSKLTVQMNRSSLPRVTLQQDYCAMLGQEEFSDAHSYLKKAMSEAKDVLYGLGEREKTLHKLILALTEYQRGFFLRGEDLKPLTMVELARRLDCSVSTVSRAVQDKYILFGEKLLPLRSLFVVGLNFSGDEAVASGAIKRQLQNFIAGEDKARPLSDESLRAKFSELGLNISRRTIAKYRSELNIPSTTHRRRR